MRWELLHRRLTNPPRGEAGRAISAAVVRPHPRGMLLELGPADGPPELRLTFSSGEVSRLISTLQTVKSTGREQVLIVD